MLQRAARAVRVLARKPPRVTDQLGTRDESTIGQAAQDFMAIVHAMRSSNAPSRNKAHALGREPQTVRTPPVILKCAAAGASLVPAKELSAVAPTGVLGKPRPRDDAPHPQPSPKGGFEAVDIDRLKAAIG